MPPNIVLFVADDIPRNMLGAYGARSDLSPNLDALAREGVVFERAFTTAPLCTPSRFALLTGRYASNASSIVSHRPWNMVAFNTFLTGAEPTLAARLRRARFAGTLSTQSTQLSPCRRQRARLQVMRSVADIEAERVQIHKARRARKTELAVSSSSYLDDV